MQGGEDLRAAIMTRLPTGMLVQCTPLSKGPTNLNTAAVWTHHCCRAAQERGRPGSAALVPLVRLPWGRGHL